MVLIGAWSLRHRQVGNKSLKAHVQPNSFARLCFCFETIFLPNAVFWLASIFEERCVSILKTTARETTILVTNLETLVRFSPPQCWFGICSHLSAPKYAWLNIGEGEGHIWLRTKVWRVNVRNSEKIQDKWPLFQRFVTSIVAFFTLDSPKHCQRGQ